MVFEFVLEDSLALSCDGTGFQTFELFDELRKITVKSTPKVLTSSTDLMTGTSIFNQDFFSSFSASLSAPSLAPATTVAAFHGSLETPVVVVLFISRRISFS